MPTTTSTSAKTRTKPQANTRSGRRTSRNPRSKSEGEDEKDEARPLGKKTQTKKTPPARPRSAHVAREREDANEEQEQEQQGEEEMIGSDKAKSAAAGRSGVKAAAGRVKRSLEDDDVESTPVTGREAKAKANGARKRKVYDSDALDDDYEDDDDDEEEEQEQEGGKDAASEKRKRGPAASSFKTPSRSPRKTKKQRRSRGDAEEDLDVEDGQEVVGVVVQAPKTGRVPAGQVSQNTLDFLTMLKDPECNDREWFKLHEPVYRQAEQEWKDFVQAFTDNITEADSQIPHLPAKDVIYRIYRDIRFSNDKTPYKTNFSATFSRSGRKGIFAGYHIMVQPGNGSLIAAGSWCPGKNEIATIRSNIQRNSRRLREVISAPEFVSYFGEPKPRKDGERRNIFGMEDELKTAPKGVDKNHRDIDLLKCRSFVVLHRFLDSEVLQPDFREKLADVARVMKPLVHCLNDYMTVSNDDSDDDGDDGDGDDGDAAESGGEGPASE